MKDSICILYRFSSGTAQGSARGFTLIELSIVLVIIGLVVGGVLVGRDLIEAAKVRGTAAQIQQYNTAVNTFRLKYSFMPGDIPASNAQSFGLPYEHQSNRNSGDGNGSFNCIQNLNFCDTDRHGWVNGQMYFFFMQLASAGLIEGNYAFYLSGYNAAGVYTGTYGSTMNAGTDYPALKLNPTAGVLPVTSRIFGGNWFMLSCRSPSLAFTGWIHQNCAFPNASGVLNHPEHGDTRMFPMQAFALDSKIDDGIPGAGGILAVETGGGPIGSATWDQTIYLDDNPNLCVTTNTSRAYNVSNETAQCSLIAKMQ